MRTSAIWLGLLLTLAPAARAQYPICIVNGVRIDNGGTAGRGPLRLGDVDPNAIENIEVLKGTAAVGLYGPDAINGVISIKTKKDVAASQNWSSVCGAPSRVDVDPLAKYLYAPEFVMAHQDAIGLTDRQRGALEDLVREIQSKAINTQLKLAAGTEKLVRLLASPTVDEVSTLQQIDQVLALERDVKRAQITLLVRIKNQLSLEQQSKLDKLR
jgi:TonB-dependent SusC/RagA subfamily outer membrane receptor